MSERPKRIQRQRVQGWRLPPNTVYVGRETKWGARWMPAHFWWARDRTQAYIDVYRDAIVRHLQGNPSFLVPLRGKDLACWCPLDQPCHADVLLDLANRYPMDEDDPLLSLTCPECDHALAHISVRSQTILTVKCVHCRHMWSTVISMLPEHVLKRLPRH
jgi:hypothetical protein